MYAVRVHVQSKNDVPVLMTAPVATATEVVQQAQRMNVLVDAVIEIAEVTDKGTFVGLVSDEELNGQVAFEWLRKTRQELIEFLLKQPTSVTGAWTLADYEEAEDWRLAAKALEALKR